MGRLFTREKVAPGTQVTLFPRQIYRAFTWKKVASGNRVKTAPLVWETAKSLKKVFLIHGHQTEVTISASQSMCMSWSAWQEVTDERCGCFPFMMFLETIYNCEIVTSGWRPCESKTSVLNLPSVTWTQSAGTCRKDTRTITHHLHGWLRISNSDGSSPGVLDISI